MRHADVRFEAVTKAGNRNVCGTLRADGKPGSAACPAGSVTGGFMAMSTYLTFDGNRREAFEFGMCTGRFDIK